MKVENQCVINKRFVDLKVKNITDLVVING